MKKYLIISLALFSSCSKDTSVIEYKNNEFKKTQITSSTKVEVYCFLSYHCPLSIGQVEQLKLIQAKYDKQVVFKTIIPEKSFQVNDDFQNSVLLTLGNPIYIDSSLNFTKKWKVKLVPEYRIVYNSKSLYSGAFDNSYKGVNMPSYKNEYINYIQNSLDQFNNKLKINPSKTEAFGCKIE